MKEFVSIFIFLVLFSLFSSLVLAQEIVSGEEIKSVLANFLAVPEEWLEPPALIFNFFIPFLTILAVLLGFLKTVRIFDNAPNIQLLLAVFIAFSTMPVGAFYTFVFYANIVMGVFAFVFFIVLFFVGLSLYVAMKVTGWKGSYHTVKTGMYLKKTYIKNIMSIQKEIGRINSKLSEIDKEIFKPGISDERYKRLKKEQERLINRRIDLLAELRRMETER